MKIIIEGRLHIDHGVTRGLRLLREVVHNAHRQSPEESAGCPIDLDTISRDLIETIRTHLQECERTLDSLNQHDVAADGETFEATIVGDGAEDLARGMVLIDFGPVAVEVCAEELRRALMPYAIGGRAV